MRTDELTKAQFERVIEGFLEHFKGDLVPTEILKNLVRHDAAIRARLEKAEMGQGQIDLYRDEFKRIRALDVNGEVNGICERAVKDIERRVSLISELEYALETLAKSHRYGEDMRANRDNVIAQAVERESLLIRKLHEKDRQLGLLEQQLCNFHEEIDSLRVDARRYHRMRVLGCAPYMSRQLGHGSVLRFTGLDSFIDADIKAYPSRGEALSTNQSCSQNGLK